MEYSQKGCKRQKIATGNDNKYYGLFVFIKKIFGERDGGRVMKI